MGLAVQVCNTTTSAAKISFVAGVSFPRPILPGIVADSMQTWEATNAPTSWPLPCRRNQTIPLILLVEKLHRSESLPNEWIVELTH
jgi:hypothetical protein